MPTGLPTRGARGSLSHLLHGWLAPFQLLIYFWPQRKGAAFILKTPFQHKILDKRLEKRMWPPCNSIYILSLMQVPKLDHKENGSYSLSSCKIQKLNWAPNQEFLRKGVTLPSKRSLTCFGEIKATKILPKEYLRKSLFIRLSLGVT